MVPKDLSIHHPQVNCHPGWKVLVYTYSNYVYKLLQMLEDLEVTPYN